MNPITVGDEAPDVTFATHDGQEVTLSDYRGKQAVVLFFYPKDNSRVCTREACSFRDSYREFIQAGAVVIGISGDTNKSHQAFAASYQLPYLLAADVDGSLRRAFGVPKTLGLVPGRVTYVIDRAGIVRLAFNSLLRGEKHVAEALRTIRQWNGTSNC